VKALPPALSDAWAQLPGETDDEYEAFLVWLDGGDARRSPAAMWSNAANRYDWAARVLAYERAEAITAPRGETPEIQITNNLLHLAQIEAGKLLRSSATSVGPIISVTDLVKVLSFLADMQRKGEGDPASRAPADVPDYKALSTEDLRKLFDAQEIMLRAKGL
jgi:hypothetical protein